MLTALIAILALAASLWNVSQPLRREELRAIARKQRGILWILCGCVVVGLAAFLGRAAWVACWLDDPRIALARVDAFAAGYFALLAILAAFTLSRRRWTAASSRALGERLNHLLRTGQHGVVAGLIAKAFPSNGEASEIDKVELAPIILRCFLADGFAKTLVIEQPELAGKLLKTQHRLWLDCTDQILAAAFSGTSSVLAAELRQCTNFASGRVGYRIPESCILLHALLDDCSVAYRIHAWTVIGDGVRNVIAERQVGTTPDLDNLEWDERIGPWKSPIGVGLWFFRVMLTNSLAQGVRDHMWLYYLPHFVEDILASTRLKIDDPDRE